MLKSLNYCYKNKKAVSLFCNRNDTEQHLTGFIGKVNDSEVLIYHITNCGYYDGYILKRIDDIFRIDYEGEYEKRIQMLYEYRNQAHREIDTFDDDNDQIFFSLLDFAIENDYIVSLEFENNYVSGIVNGYSDDVLYLSIVDDMGKEDGISIINIDDVLTVDVDSDEEQILKILRTHTKDNN